jgi:hypothetical protein
MNDQILEDALKILGPAQTAPTISEYEREQRTIRANYERLKAERLAREAIEREGKSLRYSPRYKIAS